MIQRTVPCVNKKRVIEKKGKGPAVYYLLARSGEVRVEKKLHKLDINKRQKKAIKYLKRKEDYKADLWSDKQYRGYIC